MIVGMKSACKERYSINSSKSLLTKEYLRDFFLYDIFFPYRENEGKSAKIYILFMAIIHRLIWTEIRNVMAQRMTIIRSEIENITGSIEWFDGKMMKLQHRSH